MAHIALLTAICLLLAGVSLVLSLNCLTDSFAAAHPQLCTHDAGANPATLTIAVAGAAILGCLMAVLQPLRRYSRLLVIGAAVGELAAVVWGLI